MNKELLLKALEDLRKEAKKRKFDQTVDLIINLKNIDLRVNPINLFVEIPNRFKESKICAFLEGTSSDVDRVIGKNEIQSFKEKKDIKNLAKEYDFFIASMKLMPIVATTFGKVLGPLGKMPNPKTGGVLMAENQENVKAVAAKLKKMISLKAKELSMKIAVGKESMSDEHIIDNINAIENALIAAGKRDNFRSILVKFTMTRALKVS